jgi:hypothetical protein
MARKRMIDPEFWADEKIGSLSLVGRLMFIGMWNFADDEGLLRFTPEFIKSNIFPYDTFNNGDMQHEMDNLISDQFIFPYMGGQTHQRYAYIINFLKHQTINRPQPSKLPPPSLQSPEVKKMYCQRDSFICHLCKQPVDLASSKEMASLDHVIPKNRGGSDYPSNIKVAHLSCNKSKRDSMIDSMNGSMNDSLLIEGNIREDNVIQGLNFDILWNDYPNKLGKKEAERHFTKTVRTKEDYEHIKTALYNYNHSEIVKNPKYIQHGSTWFNNWQDWIDKAPKPIDPLAQFIKKESKYGR